MTERLTAGERFYGLLLRAYPHRFGARYNDDMLFFFRTHREDPGFSGALGKVKFWLHTVGDLTRTAWSERRSVPDDGGDEAPGGIRADARYAARGLFRDPIFAIVAVLTLALGIGASTAAFSVVKGVLLTPLDHVDPDGIVRVYEREHSNPNAVMVAYGNYADLRGQTDVFEDLAIWMWNSRVFTGVEQAVSIRARSTSASLARVCRVQPALGRWFSAEEEANDDRVVVLSDGLWRNQFAADPAIVGTSVVLDGEPYAVIGVMEAGFDYPFSDAWVPLPPLTNPQGLRRWHRHNMVGRLAEGMSPSNANSLMTDFAARLEADHPDTNNGNYFEAVSLLDDAVGTVRPALLVLSAGVGALLLITCVNLTSLTLARATSRTSELALRRALGGSVGRLARMLVMESALLSLLGGALGLAAAQIVVSAARVSAASVIPRVDSVAFDVPVFVFAVALSLMTGLAVGLLPVLRLRRQSDAGMETLLGSTRTSAGGGAVRARRLLVVAQLALALVLTVTAGLLVRTFDALQSVDIGADTSSLLSLNVRLPQGEEFGGQAGADFMTGLLERIEALPGVDDAGAVLTPPVSPGGWTNNLTMRDRPVPEAELPPVLYNVVSASYFDALGVSMLSGRPFTSADPTMEGPVAVINRAAADRFWPDGDALGKEIMGTEDGRLPWLRVVGVVDDVRQSRTREAEPEVFVPMAQDWIFTYVVLARVEREPAVAALAAADLVRQANPDIPVTNVDSFESRLGAAIARPRFNAALMGGFAAVALLISAVGVYGVLAYTVVMRQREFGIRVAVGATRARVLVAVLREAGTLAGIALLIGTGGAVLLGRGLQGLLFGVEPLDLPTFGLAALCLLVVSIGAAVIPARSALSSDPVALLRDG
ncbi:MAG: FtsX-like permease family protein [Acidobacteria bacterium]|nr:FtsX-like permease family protein [Acidobacteriota bacterium]